MSPERLDVEMTLLISREKYNFSSDPVPYFLKHFSVVNGPEDVRCINRNHVYDSDEME